MANSTHIQHCGHTALPRRGWKTRPHAAAPTPLQQSIAMLTSFGGPSPRVAATKAAAPG